ncbi:hypothetical protein LBMAG56_25950 [Verrucomicrobiota bacterium]|nr:hypothetical protein LBMAG56_25950 [Verrucomicrobiota bacterium]
MGFAQLLRGFSVVSVPGKMLSRNYSVEPRLLDHNDTMITVRRGRNHRGARGTARVDAAL